MVRIGENIAAEKDGLPVPDGASGKRASTGLDDLSSVPGHTMQEENWLPQLFL